MVHAVEALLGANFTRVTCISTVDDALHYDHQHEIDCLSLVASPTSLRIGRVALTDGVGIHSSSKRPKHAAAAAPHGRLVCFNTVSVPIQEDN